MDIDSIPKTRRQKFIDRTRYETLNEDIVEMALLRRPLLDAGELVPAAVDSMLWALASESLELLVLNYTAGAPVSELRGQLPEIIDAFDAFICPGA